MLEGGLAEVDRDRFRDARDRLSTRSVRAGRRRRHRCEPGRRDRHLRGLLRRSSVSAGAGPAARCRRRSARAQDVRRLLRLRRRRHARRGLARAGRPIERRAAGGPARCRPDRGSDPGRDRERGRVGGRRWRRVTRGDRHGDAPRHELAGRSARLGRAHRAALRRPLARRPARDRAGRPVPGHAAACACSRTAADRSSPLETDACRSPADIGPSSSTWTACCSIPRRSGTGPRRSSSRATGRRSRTRTRCA